MKEEWKDIKGFEGWYQVSNLGRVRSVERRINNNGTLQTYKSHILKSSISNKGYFYVVLYKQNKATHRYIHRLIAEHFIENPKELPCVNHKDANKLNNNIINLEWCTHKQNIQHAYRNNLVDHSKQYKKVLDKTSGTIYCSIEEAARRTGKHPENISWSCRCAKKSRWSFV